VNYCSNCGEAVVVRVPEGDTLPRYVCDHCDAIHYQNPKIVAGCIPVWADRILLCKRAIEPRLGKWTLPAGFMENGETVQEAARLETMEEALARVNNLELFGMFNIAHVAFQVIDHTLKLFFEDRRADRFRIHTADIAPRR